MASAFRDTFFAYILRSAFGSRVFPHPDEKELPTIWQEKLSTQTSPRDSLHTLNVPNPEASSVHSDTTATALAPRKVDPEHGKDTLLVDWDGPTDPDVSCRSVMFVRCLLTRIVISSESAELVQFKEGMGHVPDMSSDVHHLRWICHLHCWDSRHFFPIPREQCRCDSGPHTLCRWLRTWSVKAYLRLF